MPSLQLAVRLEGASDEEIIVATLAARQVFEKAGVTPLQAAEAAFAREGYDLSGFDPEYEGYDEADASIAHLWDEAAVAAAEAVCFGWPEEVRPQRAELEIVGYPEPENDEERDKAELRTMLAMHLAITWGRTVTAEELDAEFEKVVAEMDAARRMH